MTVRMNAEQLDLELARRGWNATDLARASGCSAATISGARRGRPISSTTLCKIAEALRKAPVIPGIDDLIGTELTIVEGGAAAHG